MAVTPSNDSSSSSNSSTKKQTSSSPLQQESSCPPAVVLQFQARPTGPKCPFGNAVIDFTLREGGCVYLKGNSGLGKTTLATYMAGLSSQRHLQKLHMEVSQCEWDSSLVQSERCGVVFQQTALLDDLTVAGNLSVALDAAATTTRTTATTTTTTGQSSSSSLSLSPKKQRELKIKQLLDTVGLNYATDAAKRPSELSGGMGRRASLALQLAQNKHVIVLDEPFTGLDYDAAMSVAKELVHLRITTKTAFVLISHEPHIAAVVMDDTKTQNNLIVTLEPPTNTSTINVGDDHHHHQSIFEKPVLFGTLFRDRFLEKVWDYTVYSLPLIVLAFSACGLAIAMLSADLLNRLDVTDKVLAIVDQEVRPLIKMLTGEDANMLTMMGVKFKVRGMLNSTMPQAKATVFALGMAKLFVLEIGPLLTALLLAGRIGGSYSGKVATMQATAQTKLLRTLGVNPVWWTFVPAVLAALVAAPILTAIGTVVAIAFGNVVGGPSYYGILESGNDAGSASDFYWRQFRETTFPELRLQCFAPLLRELKIQQQSTVVGSSSDVLVAAESITPVTFGVKIFLSILRSPLDCLQTTTAFQNSNDAAAQLLGALIEVLTWPPIYHLIKALVFMGIIMGVAEVCARTQPNLTPRGVPFVITTSVVTSSLLVILADWGFSQLWLLRK